MGLTLDAFEIAHAPPTQAELAAHLREQIGSDYGLERFVVEGSRATLYCMLDMLTRPYACAFLLARGCVRIHHRTGEPAPIALPRFVERPWKSWSFLDRMRFRFSRTAPGAPVVDGRYR